MLKTLEILAVFWNLFTLASGLCSNPQGDSVNWWILYQQKERPFLHYYVDSTSKSNITLHFPEKPDSVLSHVVSSIIDNDQTEYIVYSNDLINVKKIADSMNIPSYTQWIHGILGTDTAWNSGFWLLHNNLMFPPVKRGNLVSPGSKFWIASTIGDSSADMFYVCIRSDTKDEINEMVINVLAGNPFIYNKRLISDDFKEAYLQEVSPMQFSFGLYFSAMMFMNCMYAAKSNVSQHCLYQYTATAGIKISIFTRPRGMLKQALQFCYDEQFTSLYNFVKIKETSTYREKTQYSMFALTYSDLSGTTCFGQDIAATMETVAVMVCVQLPDVYRDLISLSKVSRWSCPNSGKLTASSGNAVQKYHIPLDHHVISAAGFVHKNLYSNEKTANSIKDVTKDSRDKQLDKFCSIHECDSIWEPTKINDKDLILSKNPFLKNSKLSEWFQEMTTDIEMHYNFKNPRKKKKLPRKEKTAIILRSEKDINTFLLNNQNSVLSLFCRDGCRFCQGAKVDMIFLGRMIQVDYLDVVLAEAQDPALPFNLRVGFTPFLRFKGPGKNARWVDYIGKEINLKLVLAFLHNVTLGFKESTNNIDLEQITRRKRDTYYSEKYSIRKKRDVNKNFEEKHVWFRDSEMPITRSQVNKLFEKPELYGRDSSTFLVTKTNNRKHLFNQLTIQTTAEYQRDMMAYNVIRNNNKGFIKQFRIDIDVKSLNVLLLNVYYGECKYSSMGTVRVGGYVNNGVPYIVHLDRNNFKNNDVNYCLEDAKEQPMQKACNNIPKTINKS